MFNNSNKTTKHSVNKCSVLFNKFRKCLVRTASIITCTAIVATSVTPAFAAGITSGITAASSYVISNGTTAAKSSVISNEVSTDTSVSWPQAPDITCESAILVDADTGSILYEKDAHRKCYPASTTKILTGLLTIENCNLSDTLTFSTAAANSINPIEDANLGMKAGEELTVEQALYALLLYSANEVAYALAEKVAGSIDAFVDMMNNKARELGAIETHFANASGLYNPNHYTSAYDMAMIARGCYNNASFVNIDSTSSSYTIPATNVTSTPRTIKHRHKMLKGREFYYEYCKGGKTGFTDESLMTLVTFAEKDGMRLICVVFRSPDDSTRFIDTRSLFDWGFNNFKKSTTSDTQISSLFSTDNYYSSDVFNKSKLNFNMNASFITIPNSGSTSSVTMSLDKNYDITNEQGRLAAKLNYLYGDNVVGSTTLSITGGDNSNESLLPYLSAKNNSTQLSPKRCIKINIWVIAGIVAVILIIFTIINNASLSKKRSKYSKRKLRF